MIKINDEYRVVKDGKGDSLSLEKYSLQEYEGVGKDRKKLDKPVYFWKKQGKYYPTIEAAVNGVKRQYIRELADEEKLYEINQIAKYLKEKGL